YIADEEARPAELRRLAGETFEQVDQPRVTPVAIARQPHDLPGLAVDRQRLRAGEAAVRVEADRAGREAGRGRLAAEQFLGRQLWIVRIGERRQRLWLERALVLRRRGGGGEHENDSRAG